MFIRWYHKNNKINHYQLIQDGGVFAPSPHTEHLFLEPVIEKDLKGYYEYDIIKYQGQYI